MNNDVLMWIALLALIISLVSLYFGWNATNRLNQGTQWELRSDKNSQRNRIPN